KGTKAKSDAEPMLADTRDATAQAPNSARPDNSNPRSDQHQATKPDGVPVGGCMPIGLTAQGNLVFPLQCRAILEQQGEAAHPSPAKPAETPSLAKPAETPSPAKPAQTASSGPAAPAQPEAVKPSGSQTASV